VIDARLYLRTRCRSFDEVLGFLEFIYLGKTAAVACLVFEMCRKECQRKVERKCVPEDTPAQAYHVHIVIFHSLMGGKTVGYECRPDPRDLVGGN
jgi:hypothetical protein